MKLTERRTNSNWFYWVDSKILTEYHRHRHRECVSGMSPGPADQVSHKWNNCQVETCESGEQELREEPPPLSGINTSTRQIKSLAKQKLSRARGTNPDSDTIETRRVFVSSLFSNRYYLILRIRSGSEEHFPCFVHLFYSLFELCDKQTM